MKKTLITLFFIISFNTFADAGYSYRFYGKIELKNNTQMIGYFYVYSYDEYKENKSVIDFYKDSYRKRIVVYSSIKTVSIYSNYDFAIKNSDTTIEIEDIQRIVPFEVLSFTPDQRLVLLNKNEYSVINCNHKMNVETISLKNSDFFENSSDFILSAISQNELKVVSKELSTKLNAKIKELGSLEGKNGNKYYTFYNQQKNELVKKGILLISVSYAL